MGIFISKKGKLQKAYIIIETVSTSTFLLIENKDSYIRVLDDSYMSTHKKIISVIFLAAVLLLIALITQGSNSSLNTLEKNWNIVIPQNSEILYEMDEKANIFGDGCRYHILECDIKNISADISFKPYAEISSKNASEITDILDLLEIPNEKRPKSIDLYYNAVSGKGTASDKLYLLEDSNNQILYVIESFY